MANEYSSILSLRNIRIGPRLSIAFGILALIVFLLGGASLHNINRMYAAEHEIVNNRMPSLGAIADVNLSLMRFRIFTLRTTLSESPEALASTEARLQSVKADVDTTSRHYEQLITESEEREAYARLKKIQSEYIAGADEVLRLMKNGEPDNAKKVIETRLNKLADEMTALLLSLNKINEEGAQRAANQAELAYKNSRNTVTINK